MTSQDRRPLPLSHAASANLLPILLLFIGSGCAALIYEVVWLQLLQLVLGSTAVSLGVLLGTFMGGMCLGSLLLPRFVSAKYHPLRVYAFLELGIGLIGLLAHFGIPWLDEIYTRNASGSLGGVFPRAVVAALCLLPPAVLMGATLPAVARWVEATTQGVSWLGFFYGSNIAGAVIGCLLAGFYLLPFHNMAFGTYAAVTVNVAVAGIGFVLAWLTPYEARAIPGKSVVVSPAKGTWAARITIFLSGMAALGGEVVWTRLLSLMLGGTVYTFSLILASFLLGLGLGSSVGALATRGRTSPRLALGLCQFLLCLAIAWTAWIIARSLPYWPIDPSLSKSPWYTFQLDLVRCLFAVLPPAALWGASFPLALAAVTTPGQDPATQVASTYAANTAGAITGALAFPLLVIPTMGTAWTQSALIVTSALAALIVLVPYLLDVMHRESGWGEWLGEIAVMTGAVGIAAWLAWGVAPLPWEVVAFGRHAAVQATHLAPGVVTEAEIPQGNELPDTYCIYVGQGMNVSVAVTKTRSGVLQFHGAGKVQASSLPADMRLQRMLGHIPALLHKKPESVLVVACGAGVTAGSFIVHPDVKRIVICDIEPLVPTKVTPMFGKENYHVVDGISRQNPIMVNGKQVEVIYDDGRHFLRTTKEKFDIITSDPIDPWVKGCAALNTVEYFEAAKEHLNPGGSVSLWIPLYETDTTTSRSLIGTFFKVFPEGLIWSNERDGRGYDAVLFAQNEPTVVHLDELQNRLDRPDHRPVRESLAEIGFGVPRLVLPRHGEILDISELSIDLMATYAGQAPHLGEWTQSAQINTDRDLRLQYLAGLSLNSTMSAETLKSILEHYRFPAATFPGSPARVHALRSALEATGRR